MDIFEKFDHDRKVAASLLTDVELANQIAETERIRDNADDSTYAGVASGDSAADDLVFLYAERGNRSNFPLQIEVSRN